LDLTNSDCGLRIADCALRIDQDTQFAIDDLDEIAFYPTKCQVANGMPDLSNYCLRALRGSFRHKIAWSDLDPAGVE
jgi:hypothetical protein